ncbi:MAG TPA: hypothetical protein VEN81_01895 [Planctomycetota bacterium]|nr:hypothetical protein [Planctomycetota bacterium]
MFRPPEYAALINPIACNAFAMRCEGRADVKQTVTVDSTLTQGSTLNPLQTLNFTTSSQVCDAKMFVLPYVELVTPVTPDYLGQFHIAQLTFAIDQELVINQSSVQNHLLCPACLVAAQPTNQGVQLIAGVSEDELLGGCQMFFLPNGTNMIATLTGIPTGAGVLRINTGSILANYTTKARQGCLFGVGALDAQQQAYPVSYPCPSTFGAASQPQSTVPASSPTAGPTMGPANQG